MWNLFYILLYLYITFYEISEYGQGRSRIFDNNLKENFPTRIICFPRSKVIFRDCIRLCAFVHFLKSEPIESWESLRFPTICRDANNKNSIKKRKENKIDGVTRRMQKAISRYGKWRDENDKVWQRGIGR